jgi:hypothetical protein
MPSTQSLEAIRAALDGGVATAFGASVVFFQQFWRRTGDRLFLLFSWAFTILALERTLVVLLSMSDEARSYLYLIRLAAFLLILFAIWEKNRPTTKGP